MNPQFKFVQKIRISFGSGAGSLKIMKLLSEFIRLNKKYCVYVDIPILFFTVVLQCVSGVDKELHF